MDGQQQKNIDDVSDTWTESGGANRVLCMKFRTESTGAMGTPIILYEISHRIDGFDKGVGHSV